MASFLNSIVRVVFDRKMLLMLVLGFSSGLPLALTASTLQAWMTEAGSAQVLIGMVGAVGTPYSLKLFWAPLADRYRLPILGRRRGFIFVFQLALLMSIVLLGFAWSPPGADVQVVFPGFLEFLNVFEKGVSEATNVWQKIGLNVVVFLIFPIKFLFQLPMLLQVFYLPLLVAFFSASQDVVVDAYRTEILEPEERGFGSSVFVAGYRIAMLTSGALALGLAESLTWPQVFMAMGICMSVGLLATVFAPNETEVQANRPQSVKDAYLLPLVEFFKRAHAFEILLFVLLFKLGDVMTGSMTTTFLLKTGFEKIEIAQVNKGIGLIMTIAGGLIGGAVMTKIGMMPSLWIFGIFQAVSNLGFGLLAYLGLNHPAMVGVIAFENLSGGLGTAAYVAFLMSLCNVRFTAAQYAVFTSLMAIPRTILGASSGALSVNLGWELYFVFCTLAAIPGLLMILRYPRWKESIFEGQKLDVSDVD